MAYQHPRASISINGASSSHFDISRGTRQGNPLSPLLFALAIEPLAEALRRSEDYEGIQIGKSIHKLSLFADDLFLFIKHPEDSLRSKERLLDIFQKISGLRVNADKSLLYCIHGINFKNDTYLNLLLFVPFWDRNGFLQALNLLLSSPGKTTNYFHYGILRNEVLYCQNNNSKIRQEQI